MGKRLTSGYTLVIHEVTQSSVKLWLGALAPSLAKPHNWRLVIKKSDSAKMRANEDGVIIQTLDRGNIWQRPFDKLNKRFYNIELVTDLEPDTYYIAEFHSRTNQQWKLLEKAFFTTLPNRLPGTTKKPFTVGIGSCFYTEHDGGSAGQAFEALYKHEALRPDLKFLAGDQVYLDIGLGWYPLDAEDCQDRVADGYVDSWKYLRSILRRGGTWFLPDDHEFWNDYPYLEGFNPYLLTLKLSDDFRERWKDATKQAVKIIQQVEPLRFFSIGDDLSFCIADLRSERSNQGFHSAQSQQQLLAWITNLQSPGVLVIPQPLISASGGSEDKNLPDWEQYNEIILAIQNGNHDIVVLTGDVHYGRVSQVVVGNSSNKLTEIITSPISNLSEMAGIATSTPKLPNRRFPFISINGVEKNKVTYLGKVTTEGKWWDIRYPVKRTHEHFMTVEFYKDKKQTKMKVHAWHAREMIKSTGLPKKIKGFNIKPITLV
ncbi:MAG: hypothetical protein OEY29_08370 [Gammaproteobacteria bacterium]|nr:hypothetical protein [Gammaproteobacteria bacterium]